MDVDLPGAMKSEISQRFQLVCCRKTNMEPQQGLEHDFTLQLGDF